MLTINAHGHVRVIAKYLYERGEIMANIQLHPYQETAKQFLITHPKAALFLDVGLGKTLITLETLKELAARRQIHGHILIIAPKAVARSTWINEMEKWGIRANTVSLIVNTKGKQLSKAKRLELYAGIENQKPSFYFINRELVVDLVKWHSDNKKPWLFPTIIVDEFHSFKSHSSQRFKALKAVMPYTTRLIGLTGTPRPNGLMDLWALIYLLDGGQRLGKNITEYRNRYFTPGLQMNGVIVKWNPKPDAEPIVYDAIKDIVVSVKNPNIKLPSVTHNPIYCYMTAEETADYKNFVKDRIMTAVDNDNNELVAKANNAGVLAIRLSQMASGTLYTETEDGQKSYIVIHQHKLEMLEYIINNTGAPVLIAYYFQSEKTEIMNYLSKAGYNVQVFDGSPEMEKEWNAGNIDVMLAQPASCGCGLNLQDGGYTLVWYTLPTSLEHYIQMCGRLARQGQKHPVIIHYLLTYGTIDDRLRANLIKKDLSEKALIDAVAAAIDDAV